MTTLLTTWPEIFKTGDISGYTEKQLCAYGLCAWANCHLGNHPPDNFGEVMVKIGQRLGIAASGENLMKWADAHKNI